MSNRQDSTQNINKNKIPIRKHMLKFYPIFQTSTARIITLHISSIKIGKME